MMNERQLLVVPTGILDNPFQVREHYDPDKLAELAESIKTHGLLQIPVARFVHADTDEPAASDEYPRLIQHYRQSPLADYRLQLAFGHRRLRACQLLHRRGDLATMPMLVQSLTDEQMYQLCYEENERRSDLNAIERALMIEQAKTSLGWTDTQVADHLGLDRSAVTKIRQLLKLPDAVQTLLRAGDLSQRNAYALLKFFDLPEQVRVNAEKCGLKSAGVLARCGDMNPASIQATVLQFVMSGSLGIDFDIDASVGAPNVRSAQCRGCAWLVMHESAPRCGAPDWSCIYAKQRHFDQPKPPVAAPSPERTPNQQATDRMQHAIQRRAEDDRRDALNAHVHRELAAKLIAGDLQAWRGLMDAPATASLAECVTKLLRDTSVMNQRFQSWSAQYQLAAAQKQHDAVVKMCGITPVTQTVEPDLDPETVIAELSQLEAKVAAWCGTLPGRRRIVPARADVDAVAEQLSVLHGQLRRVGLDDINDRFRTVREQLEQIHLMNWLSSDVTAVTAAAVVG